MPEKLPPIELPYIELLDPQMIAILRGKTSQQRFEMAAGMWRFARDSIRRVVAQQHPEWSAEEVQFETARRLMHGNG